MTRLTNVSKAALSAFFLTALALPLSGMSSEVFSPRATAGKGTGVIVGSNVVVRLDNGVLQTSVDSKHWTNYCSGIRTFFRGVTYNQGLFVAVGGSYFDEPGVIVSSRDGRSWKRRHKGNRVNIYGITSSSELFVAVGEWGTILSSPDGVRWRTQSSGTQVLLASVAFGNDTFVAGGESGVVLVSTNGNRWAIHKLPLPAYIGTITFSHGQFTVQSGSTNFVSYNGVDWQTLYDHTQESR